MTDIELEALKQAHTSVEEAEATLAKVVKARAEAEEVLRRAEREQKAYRQQQVEHALDGNAAIAEPELGRVEDAQALVDGLMEREAKAKFEIASATNDFQSLMRDVLECCVARAAEQYREEARKLTKTWRDINAAGLFLENRELSWIHIFLPGMEGMRGATESHGRLALLDGKETGLKQSVKAELMGRLVA